MIYNYIYVYPDVGKARHLNPCLVAYRTYLLMFNFKSRTFPFFLFWIKKIRITVELSELGSDINF